MKEVLKRLAGHLTPSPPSGAPGVGGDGLNRVDEGDGLNHVDLCFVVDTTGSMSPFIGAARAALLDTVGALGAKGGVDLRVGLVEYRDHPPQDRSFVTRHHALTSDLTLMQKVINQLSADGGGDIPEAVYDGVSEAARLTEWRAHSCRFVMLVGDAPPHGYASTAQQATAADGGGRRAARRRGSHHSRGEAGEAGAPRCLCGLDARQASAAAEEARVTVLALPMQNDAQTVGAFDELARATGGGCAPATGAEQVVARIGEMLDAEFRELGFDREVLEAAKILGSPDAGEIAARLGRTRLQAARSLARLGRRGFLKSFELTGQAAG